MKKALLTVLVFALGLIVAGLNAADKKAEPRPVGIKIYSFDFQGKKLPAAVWYPAAKPGEKLFDYNGVNKGSAYLDAEPDRAHGPYPLILFSHGMAGCGFQSVFYTENLARAGYVVAATDHKDSLGCTISGPPKITVGKALSALFKSGGNFTKLEQSIFGEEMDMTYRYRPKEFIALLDFIIGLNSTNPEFKGLIDSNQVGVTGHSLGGFTSLAVAGAVYDCVDSSKWPDSLCKKLDELDYEQMEMDTGVICCMDGFKGKSVSFADPRIKASLPLSPAVIFPKDDLKPVKAPVMIITGSKRDIPLETIQRAYDEFSGPKYVLKLDKVTHTTIVDVTRLGFGSFQGLNQERKDIYQNFSRAFFDGYLKGDAKSLDYIRHQNYPLVDLQARP